MKKDFIAIADYSPAELQGLLDLAISLKKEHASGGNKPILKGKVLAMVFQKPSLRTRVSFDMAMRHLGGDALYLSPPKSDWASANPSQTCPAFWRATSKASWRASSNTSTCSSWPNGPASR